jgi:hypothetical protein
MTREIHPFKGAAAPGRPKRPARPRQGVAEATRSARRLGASYKLLAAKVSQSLMLPVL